MKIRTIEFTRKFNLGNYETQDIKVLAEIDDNENADAAFLQLKKKVLAMAELKDEG